jgi:hypothetical protein
MQLGEKLFQLQDAARRYGDASRRNQMMVHSVGDAMIKELATYLGEGSRILGVPPVGNWSVDKGDSRDAKFSTYWNSILLVGPISMGMAVCIPNANDEGQVWVRLVLDFLVEESAMSIRIGDGPTIGNLPLRPQVEDMAPVYDAIFLYVKGIFVDPLRYSEAQSKGKIGFLPG